MAVLINTACICIASAAPVVILPILLQALLLIGCQEAKHLCVHGTFVGNRRLNDAIGIACAALFGANFVVYRYFHLAHHQSTCTDADPEGRLYALSWSTRWIWLLAPVELPLVAWHIGRAGWSMVPAHKRAQRGAALVWMVAFATLVAIGLYYATRTVLFAYVIPLALFSWFDFILTQAEHYGVAIVSASRRRDPGAITLDILLPLGLGWPTLHRSLHRVHHRDPSLPWIDAPRRMKEEAVAAPPVTYASFVCRWLARGPRLWANAPTTKATASVSMRSSSESRQ